MSPSHAFQCCFSRKPTSIWIGLSGGYISFAKRNTKGVFICPVIRLVRSLRTGGYITKHIRRTLLSRSGREIGGGERDNHLRERGVCGCQVALAGRPVAKLRPLAHDSLEGVQRGGRCEQSARDG